MTGQLSRPVRRGEENHPLMRWYPPTRWHLVALALLAAAAPGHLSREIALLSCLRISAKYALALFEFVHNARCRGKALLGALLAALLPTTREPD